MRNPCLLLSFVLLIQIAVLTLACGTSSSQPRIANALSISPVLADAQNYPNGQVPFMATATYNAPPSPVKDLQATWGACFQGNPTAAVSVSSNGVAQCVGPAGTYTVWAFIMSGAKACPMYPSNACGAGPCQVTGTAAITCP